MKKSMKGPATVDEYMDALPEKEKNILGNLRKTIKTLAPKADEVISYGIPGYKYHGMLVYFAAFKKHCSFFPGGSSMLSKEMEAEIKPYKTSKGTLQFTIEKPLPTALVKKIVKLRIKQNLEREQLKKLKKTATKKATKKVKVSSGR